MGSSGSFLQFRCRSPAPTASPSLDGDLLQPSMELSFQTGEYYMSVRVCDHPLSPTGSFPEEDNLQEGQQGQLNSLV